MLRGRCQSASLTIAGTVVRPTFMESLNVWLSFCSKSGTSGKNLANSNIRNVTHASDQKRMNHSTPLGLYASHVYTKGDFRARPGTMIRNRSSHIPMLTNRDDQNINAMLLLTRFCNHIPTGIM